MIQDKIPHNWVICKDGVILLYEKKKYQKEKIIDVEHHINSFIVSKMASQKYFYLSDSEKKPES